MSVRETGNMVQQIAPEMTPGVIVPATKRFSSLSFEMGDTIETRQFRSMGTKSDTTSIVHKEWGQGSFSGPLSYVEIVYPLAGLFPFVVTAGLVPNSHVWVFTPNTVGNDPVKTFTLENGDDEAVEKFGYLQFQSLEIPLTLDDAQMSGNCFSRALEEEEESVGAGIGLTDVGVVQLAERPVSLREVDVFMDTTFETLGTTKITDAFEAKLSIGEKFQPKWVLNTTFQSFKDTKEIIPAFMLSLTSENNAQGRALKKALKSNPFRFFRILMTGPLISATTRYKIQIDFCGKVRAKTAKPDTDGINAYQLDFGGMTEGTMARALKIEVINMLEAL